MTLNSTKTKPSQFKTTVAVVAALAFGTGSVRYLNIRSIPAPLQFPSSLKAQQSGLVKAEFLFEKAPYKACHAATIVETPQGLVASWFGGEKEQAPDVKIWVSRHIKGQWTEPVAVADGVQSDGTSLPTWNPVLFQPRQGPLYLFYKIGKSPRRWKGFYITSRDGGKTWSQSVALPDGVLGPIKNKPVELPGGAWLSPSSTETPVTKIWSVHFERSADQGKTWQIFQPPSSFVTGGVSGIQPSVLLHPGGRLQAIGRTHRQGIFETWSNDGGQTWTPLAALPLPNPDSGVDAVTLRDGRQLLVYNHTDSSRSPLNVAVSQDGKQWQAAFVLETADGEYSYPAVIQDSKGLVHIVYTWKRLRIKHVVLDPRRLKLEPMSSFRQ